MADILIRGIEMPKDCPFCPMAHWNKIDVLTGCNVVPGKKFVPEAESEYWYSDHRPSWCPLVPLPEGHGRLIDAGKLMKKGMKLDWSVQKWVQEVDIMTAPTIVPAEGGGEADKKTNCSDCGNRNTPVCKYCEHDAEGGGADE